MAEQKQGKLRGLDRFPFMYQFFGKKTFLPYLFSVIICAGFSLMTNVFSGQLYRVVTNFGSGLSTYLNGLLQVLLMLVGILILVSIGRWIFLRCCAVADRNLRTRLVDSLARMPLGEWNKKHSADWLTALGKDADNAASLYRDPGIQVLDSVVSTVGGFIILVCVNLPMALFSLLIGFCYLWIGLSRSKSMHKKMTQIRSAAAGAAEQVSNQLAGAWAARFYRVRGVLDAKYQEKQEEIYGHTNFVAKLRAWNGALSSAGYTLSYSGALIFGLLLVYNGQLDLSTMLALWPVAMGLSFGLADFGFMLTDIQSTIAAVDRIKEVLELPREQGGTMDKKASSAPAVEFCDLSFTYEGAEQETLMKINLRVEPGERIAFVGASGSGKTTLMKLLMRFYDPSSGEVRVFGGKASDYRLPVLREQFSYVPQMAHLISGSIKDNLLLVRPEASSEQLIKAAKQANAHGFLEQIGYDTDAGEGGSHLSGGQRQRIAIARAFLKAAPILIFDEVTAALDGESEKAITDALNSAGQDQTLLLITHRLSTALLADRIVVLDAGKIVEIGKHQELLNADGYYAKLWQKK